MGQTLLKLLRTSDLSQHSWEPLAKYCLGCQVLEYTSLPKPELSCYFMSSGHTFSSVLITKGLIFQMVGEEGRKQALSAQRRWDGLKKAQTISVVKAEKWQHTY